MNKCVLKNSAGHLPENDFESLSIIKFHKVHILKKLDILFHFIYLFIFEKITRLQYLGHFFKILHWLRVSFFCSKTA